MGKMKKLSKLTAGVLSFALAMGAAGTFPPCVSRNQALASAPGYASETAYEVTIPDAYINRIYTYDDVEDLSQASILRLTVIPKKTDYYDYYDAIEISMYSPYIRSNTLDELDKEFSRILDRKVHLAACAELQRNAGQRIDEAHLVRRAPLKPHLHGLVDEIDLAVERRHAAGRKLQDLADQRNVLRFERVAPRSEQIERLSVHHKDRFLTLVDDQLRTEVEILAGMLPYKRVVVALVLDYFCNVCHKMLLPV